MTVVLAWRAMSPIACGECGGIVLAGLKPAHHLRERLAAPAYCLGYHEHVARNHLQHPAEWQPPEHVSDADSWCMPIVSSDFVHGRAQGLPAAPHEFCTCGYYALWQPIAEDNYGPGGSRPYIWCYVLALGKYVAYTKGVRMARYRLLRWWWPITLPEWRPVTKHEGTGVYLWEYPHARSWQQATWDNVAQALTLRYGMPPLVGDPRQAELPTGILKETPALIADMLED